MITGAAVASTIELSPRATSHHPSSLPKNVFPPASDRVRRAVPLQPTHSLLLLSLELAGARSLGRVHSSTLDDRQADGVVIDSADRVDTHSGVAAK